MSKPKRKPGRPPAGKDLLISKIRPLFTDGELRLIAAYVKRKNTEHGTRHTPATWLRELTLYALQSQRWDASSQ